LDAVNFSGGHFVHKFVSGIVRYQSKTEYCHLMLCNNVKLNAFT